MISQQFIPSKFFILNEERYIHTHYYSHTHTAYTHIYTIYIHTHRIYTHIDTHTYTSKQVGMTSVFYILSVEFSQVIVAMFLQKMRQKQNGI